MSFEKQTIKKLAIIEFSETQSTRRKLTVKGEAGTKEC